MGLLNGSFSITRYRCVDQPKNLSLSQLNKHFVKFKAQKLQLDRRQETLIGWDLPPTADNDIGFFGKWDLSHCQYEDGFLLRIRMESKHVSKSLLNHCYQDRLAEALKASGEVSMKERKKLLEAVKEELLKRALPKLRFIEAVWQIERQEVMLLATSKRDREVFEKLFGESFSKPHEFFMMHIEPPLLAVQLDKHGQKDVNKKRLQGIENAVPTTFFRASHL